MDGQIKKWAALLLAAVFCLGVFGCKRSDVATGFGRVADWGTGAQPHGQVEPSEIAELDSPAFGADTGFDMTAWPDDADLKPEQFFAIDGWIGQMEYHTADGRLLVVRVAFNDRKRLSSTYSESHNINRETYTVDGVEVSQREAEASCMLVTWEKGDFQYLIHSNSQQDPIPREEIDTLVRGLSAEAVEGYVAASSQSGA